MRLIDADALYEKVQHDEELARNHVLDTESTLPYPNNLNPSYTRYVAQMDERTRLKFRIADAPTIEPERKTGKWIYFPKASSSVTSTAVHLYPVCSECGCEHPIANYCPNCGARMEEGGE